MEKIEKFGDRLMKDFCSGAHGTGKEAQAVSFRVVFSVTGADGSGLKKAYFFEGAGKARFAGIIHDPYDMNVSCVNQDGEEASRVVDPTAQVSVEDKDLIDIIETGHNFQAAYLDGRMKITGETGGVLLWGLMSGLSFS